MGSPMLTASAAKLRNRLPLQMRRCAGIYLAFLLFILLILNADLLGSVRIPYSSASSLKRSSAQQKALHGASRGSGGRGSGEGPGLAMAGAKFPRKIWQTWKVDPLSFDQRDALTAKSWTTLNPDYRYEVLTDTNDLTWVQQTYGPDGLDRPDIVEVYETVNATIIKADLLRYLVMYAEGGVYADIDVEGLKPVRRFITDRFNEAEIDMVIGVEIDQPYFKNHPILGRKSQSFCQWTFMCKPGLPVMMHLVENIMAWLHDLSAEQGVPISEIELDFDEVISGTGPSAFTIAILDEMNRRAGTTGSSSAITWDRFHEMDEAHLVSGILVLDVEAFAAGQGHSDSGNHNARGALVKHHYHASNWPSRHPRFRHPVFGEVERCNWEVECVNKWDRDVEAFKALSAEEQEARIQEALKPVEAPQEDAAPAPL